MKNLLSKEYRLTPYYCIIIYIILVFLDVLTTYIVNPTLDPYYEKNPVINYFIHGWIQLILVVIFCVSTILVMSYRADLLIKKDQLKNRFNRFIHIAFAWAFYTHLFYSIYVVPNNFISMASFRVQPGELFYLPVAHYVTFMRAEGYWVCPLLVATFLTISIFIVRKRVQKIKV